MLVLCDVGRPAGKLQAVLSMTGWQHPRPPPPHTPKASQAPPAGQTAGVQNLRSSSSSRINSSSFVLGSELPRFDYRFWVLFVCFCCRQEQIMTGEGVGAEIDT